MGLSPEVFDDEVPSDILCSICSYVLDFPVETPCGHHFCQNCLKETYAKIPSCPKCSHPIESMDEVKNDLRLGRLIGARNASCPWIGCTWKGCYDARGPHLLQCMFVEEHCDFKSWGCESTYRRDKIAAHMRECTFRPVDCRFCKMTLPEAQLEEHMSFTCESAPSTVIECPAGCGFKIMRRDQGSHLVNVCTERSAPCEHKSIGCPQNVIRSKQWEHNESYAAHHLQMIIDSFKTHGTDMEAMSTTIASQAELIDKTRKELDLEREQRKKDIVDINSVAEGLREEIVALQNEASETQKLISALTGRVGKTERTVQLHTIEITAILPANQFSNPKALLQGTTLSGGGANHTAAIKPATHVEEKPLLVSPTGKVHKLEQPQAKESKRHKKHKKKKHRRHRSRSRSRSHSPSRSGSHSPQRRHGSAMEQWQENGVGGGDLNEMPLQPMYGSDAGPTEETIDDLLDQLTTGSYGLTPIRVAPRWGPNSGPQNLAMSGSPGRALRSRGDDGMNSRGSDGRNRYGVSSRGESRGTQLVMEDDYISSASSSSSSSSSESEPDTKPSVQPGHTKDDTQSVQSAQSAQTAVTGTSKTSTSIPSQIGRKTFHVDRVKGPYKSISKAIADCNPGEVILVHAGTYIESLLVEKPVEIIGKGHIQDIIIDANGRDTLVLDSPVAVLQNLTLKQNGSGYWCCVDIVSGEPRIEECDLSSASMTCISIHHKHTTPRIGRCKIHDCTGNGISLYDNGGGIIEDNDIAGCLNAGIEISENANPFIRFCKVSTNHQSGVLIFENGKGILEDNDIFHNHVMGVEIRESANPTLRRNKIHRQMGNSGVFIHGNGRGLFEKNEIFSNCLHGITVCKGGKPVCRQNRISKNGEFAINVWDGGWGTFEDNDLRNNGRGAFFVDPTCEIRVVKERNLTA